MIINYGINRKVGKKFEHKNRQINLPEIYDSNWDETCSNGYIRKEIQKCLPKGWAITGWVMHNYTTEEDYRYIKLLLQNYTTGLDPNGVDALDRIVKRLREYEKNETEFRLI